MDDFVEAVPWNGEVVHAIRAQGLENALPRVPVRYRAVCGVRGRDGNGYGGMIPALTESGALVSFEATDPNPHGKTSWNGQQLNEWCPRCIGRVARMRKQREQDQAEAKR